MIHVKHSYDVIVIGAGHAGCEAALAQRQFNRVDPDNRLVAVELEKRWETALRVLKQAEAT